MAVAVFMMTITSCGDDTREVDTGNTADTADTTDTADTVDSANSVDDANTADTIESADECASSDECERTRFCQKDKGNCNGNGLCIVIPKCDAVGIGVNYVCGCDNITYDNECFALKKEMNIAHQGKCEEVVEIPKTFIRYDWDTRKMIEPQAEAQLIIGAQTIYFNRASVAKEWYHINPTMTATSMISISFYSGDNILKISIKKENKLNSTPPLWVAEFGEMFTYAYWQIQQDGVLTTQKKLCGTMLVESYYPENTQQLGIFSMYDDGNLTVCEVD